MKIAALAPQFMVEAPDEVEGVEGDRIVEDLHHLHVVEASSVDESTGGSPSRSQLDDETRQGLKRLSELIRKRGRDGNESAFERRRRKAHVAYVSVAQPLLESEVKGRWVNLFA